jgi:hypothetical protein
LHWNAEGSEKDKKGKISRFFALFAFFAFVHAHCVHWGRRDLAPELIIASKFLSGRPRRGHRRRSRLRL